MKSILIIDDDQALRRSLELQLQQRGFDIRGAGSVADGAAAMERARPDLILLDITLPDESGLDALARFQAAAPDVPIVMITGRQDMQSAIQAMRAGAFDYLRKPFDLDDALALIEKAGRAARPAGEKGEASATPLFADPHEIVGRDSTILDVVKQIGLLSRSAVTVLIEGESGTGKELIARALHEAGCPGRPFVAVNCSALVPTLLGSELFGHERGAFTGAHERKTGKLEHAGEGTVFLDEIGDMPLEQQAKLLRALQEREFERVGGLQSIPFRARVIAASNRDLEAMVREGVFREDLFFRLAVARIRAPALRERRGDIGLLAEHLLRRIAERLHRPCPALSTGARRALEAYDWPGNVRELENALTRALALCRGDAIGREDLAFSGVGASERARGKAPLGPDEIVPLAQVEKEYIERALLAGGWNITQTSRLLGIAPNTLRKKISDYGLEKPSALPSPLE